MFKREYEIEPSGLIIVFSIIVKFLGSPMVGNPVKINVPVERLPLRGVDSKPTP